MGVPVVGEVGKQLGQLRPANTNAASLYGPPENKGVIVDKIVVCNVTANTPTFRVFHDEDGTTYDQTTALAYDEALPANQRLVIDGPFYMRNTNGNLAVRSSANDEITFTAYGREL